MVIQFVFVQLDIIQREYNSNVAIAVFGKTDDNVFAPIQEKLWVHVAHLSYLKMAYTTKHIILWYTRHCNAWNHNAPLAACSKPVIRSTFKCVCMTTWKCIKVSIIFLPLLIQQAPEDARETSICSLWSSLENSYKSILWIGNLALEFRTTIYVWVKRPTATVLW